MKLPILFILMCLVAFGAAREVNEKTLDLIKNHKKWMPKANDDGSGFLQIGYGHTINKRDGYDENSVITKKQGEKLLKGDLSWYEDCVEAIVPKVPLNDNEFGALVSWTFVIGCPQASGSELIKKLNKGNKNDVCDELRKWKEANLGPSPDLVGRREEECKLFTSK